MHDYIPELSVFSWSLVFIAALWDAVWKLIAMWHAARRGEKWWFVLLAIINSVGILPIIYLLIKKQKEKEAIAE